MSKPFEKSLFGYKTSQVDMAITEIEGDLKNETNQLLVELDKLNVKNNYLKSEIKSIERELKSSGDTQKSIQDRLYNAYIEKFGEVYNMQKKYEQMLSYKKRILEGLENKI
jgi:uncharacterized protein YlxW (UPF0749 family)